MADINAALATAGLATTRRYRRLMRLLVLLLFMAGAGTGAALAARWIEPGAGWIPLLAIWAAALGGLIRLSARSATRAGRRQLADTKPVMRHMLEYLGPEPALDTSEAEAAVGQDQPWPALDAHDVAGVALAGVPAIKDRELRARLLKRPPAGPVPRDTLAADMGLTRDARGAGWPV